MDPGKKTHIHIRSDSKVWALRRQSSLLRPKSLPHAVVSFCMRRSGFVTKFESFKVNPKEAGAARG